MTEIKPGYHHDKLFDDGDGNKVPLSTMARKHPEWMVSRLIVTSKEHQSALALISARDRRIAELEKAREAVIEWVGSLHFDSEAGSDGAFVVSQNEIANLGPLLKDGGGIHGEGE